MNSYYGSYSYSSASNTVGGSIGVWGSRMTTFNLTTKARCLTAQLGETSLPRFFVGTTSLRNQNEIVLVEPTDQNSVKTISTYEHEHEIWHISACPFEKDLLFTVFNTVPNYRASLWKLGANSLEFYAQIGDPESQMRCVLWRPMKHGSSDAHIVLGVDTNNIQVWDLTTCQKASHVAGGDLSIFTMGSWDPHVVDLVATACGPDIVGYDIRQNSKAFSINRAHGERSLVRDIDFNPNHMFYFVSGGDDSKIKFWDRRKTDKSLKVLSKHSHWVWKVQYHPVYDVLLLSASSDKTLSLWNVRSITHKPQGGGGGVGSGGAGAGGGGEGAGAGAGAGEGGVGGQNNTHRANVPKRADKLIKTYQGHEDSIYGAAWAPCNPENLVDQRRMWDWTIFASLSYDGRVLFNRIPDPDRRQALAS